MTLHVIGFQIFIFFIYLGSWTKPRTIIMVSFISFFFLLKRAMEHRTLHYIQLFYFLFL
jgi:hypothetical protein